jgi:hypothetical protein
MRTANTVPNRRAACSATPGLRDARVGALPVDRHDAGLHAAEQQPELGVVRGGPAPEGAAAGEQLDRGRGGPGGVPGLLEDGDEFVVQVGDDVLDEVLAAVEVAVEARGGHAHGPRDGAQRQPVRPLLDQYLPGGVLDVTDGVGTLPVTSADEFHGLSSLHLLDFREQCMHSDHR